MLHDSNICSVPSRLMLGLMIPTWFLSMWISNTAAAAMMIPIVGAVTSQVKSVVIEGKTQFSWFSYEFYIWKRDKNSI